MKKCRSRWYVGWNHNERIPFSTKLSKDSIREDYAHIYAAVIGPFRTKQAAKIMAFYGEGNPHMQSVADVERIVDRYNAAIKQALDAVVQHNHLVFNFEFSETKTVLTCKKCGKMSTILMFNPSSIDGDAAQTECVKS